MSIKGIMGYPWYTDIEAFKKILLFHKLAHYLEDLISR